MASISHTALSQKLSPPVRPIYRTPYGIVTKIAIGICGSLVLWALIAVLEGAILALLGCLFYGSILGVIVFYKESVARKRRAAFDAAMSIYTAAYSKWHQLYYCARDDTVFIPGSPAPWVPASQMQKLLYGY